MWRPAPVSDLLSALLRGTPGEKRIKEGGIWEVWDEAVGSGIASHAQPIAFRDGTLTLCVDSAPWMQQLTFLKRDLIAKVNERLGEEMVKEIYMKGGKIARAPVQKPHKPKRRELSAEERSLIQEQIESVSDPELRAVFERLIKRDRENR
jgi:predicted nucleic acid-binding Zn ribbon protein